MRLRIEEDNRKSKKRSSKNSYEAKANVIEDSKGKASTFKGLKRKKTAQGTKARIKKARTSASRKFAIYTIKRDTRQMNIAVVPKRIRNHPQANLTDHALPSLLAVVSEMNLATNNKDWWVDTGATRHTVSYTHLTLPTIYSV